MTRADLLAQITAIPGRRSRQVLITGDPGIGKSTLMAAVADRLASAGSTVLRSSPAFAERHTSYSMLWDLLSTLDCSAVQDGSERLGNLLGTVTDTRRTPAEVPALATALALEEVLAELSLAAPVVLLIDDAQWSDAESVAVVERAFRRTAGLPVSVVAAGRTSRDPAATALDLTFDRADTYVMDGLNVDELQRAVSEGWPSTLTQAQVVALHAHTGGNPMWALELVARGAIGDLGALAVGTVDAPLSLVSALTERLQALSKDAGDVVSIVALLGRPRRELLTSVLRFAGISADATDEAEAAGYLSLTTGTVQTGHPLQASAAVARLTPARRRELQRFIAHEVDDPVLEAQHLQQSQPVGPDETIAVALGRAAAVMHAQGARLRSAHFAAQAVDRTDPRGDHYQSRRLYQAQQLFSAGDHVACLRLLDRLHAPALDLFQYDSFIALTVSSLAFTRGHDAVAEFLGTQAGQVASDPHRLAVVRASTVADDLMTVAAREQTAVASLTALVGVEVPNAVHRALKGRIRAQLDSGGGLNHDLVDDSTQRQGRQIVAGLEDTGLATTGFLAHLVDDVSSSRDALARMVEWARSEGKEGVERVFAAHAAHVEITAGDLAAAHRHAAASAYEASSPALPPTALPVLGLLLLHGGRHDELERLVSRWERTGPGSGSFAHLVAPALRGLSALALQRWPQAVEHLRLAADRFDALGIVEPGSRFRTDLALAEALLMTGETAEATTRLDSVRAFLITHDRPVSRVGLHRVTSMRLAAVGDLDGALLESASAVDLAVRTDRPGEESLARLQRARVLLRQRKVTLGRRELESALARAAGSGNADILARAGTALAASRRVRSSSQLTTAEQRVLGVVLRGQTNKEIAAELFVSRRTVESHVAAILRKTGATSRSKLRHAG